MIGNDNKPLLLIIPVLLVILFSGCSTLDEQKERTEKYTGQLTLFINGPDKKPVNDITFRLQAVNIINEDGGGITISGMSMKINSFDIEGRQLLLGERSLPEGKYKKLQFIIGEALWRKKDRESNLALSDKTLEIPVNIDIQKEQNTSIFVNWNADASIVDGYLFKPVLIVKTQVPELSSLLIYVTNEESDNVSVINKQTGEVVATIMVGKSPRGIAAVSKRDRSRVYVANSGSNSVSVIDPTINRVENEIPVKFGKSPEGIAVAAVSEEKELVFVSNFLTNTVSVIDSITFNEIEKVDVGQGPVAVAADPPVDELIGTRYLDYEDVNVLRSYREKFFNVYVANRNSNNISVIRMNSLTGMSEEVVNVNVGWDPLSLTVDYRRGRVYVVNYGSDKLSVIDIVQVVRGNEGTAVSNINNVGQLITGIILDPSFNRMYLLKESPGEIIILRPFSDSISSLKSVMPPVLGSIPVGQSPRSFILGPEVRKIYVTNRGSNTISVVDKTSKKQEQVIHVGKRPYGIAIFKKR